MINIKTETLKYPNAEYMGPNPTDAPNPVLEHRWQIRIPIANTPLRQSVCEREKF